MKKKAINYYSSFFDVSKELSKEQFYHFNMAIFEVMFFDKHIDSIEFEDKMLIILWKSVKHSIYASVKGFCDKNKTPYDELFNTLDKGVVKGVKIKHDTPTEQEKEKEKEKEQGKGEVTTITKKFSDDSFRLSDYLYRKILTKNQSFKKPNLESWAKDIDKAIRIDKRTVEQLRECIDWIYSDQGKFWQSNILSGKKLRDKFDMMNMQVITATPTKQQQQLSESAKAIYKAMKARGHTDEEIEQELRKIS